MIKAIIFDCFGVLYPDTYWTMAHEYLGQNLETHRQQLHDLVKRVDLGHITRDQLWHEFASIVGEDVEAVYARLDEFNGLDKRLLNFIENNKSSYKFGMISNVGQGFIERMFKDKPVEHYFDSIVLSSEVGIVKPDRRIYELSAKQLRCDVNECVFLDDIARNADGAVAAGMQSIQYRDYTQAMPELEKLLAADADE